MSPRDIWVIAKFELARHLRSRHAVVAGILLVAFCGFGSYRLAEYADRIAAVGKQLGPVIDMIAGMVEGVTDLPVVSIRHMLNSHPPVLVALFALVMSLMPMLCCILAYDQTATDIETKHVRYLLFRSDRVSIYLGKSLGALMLIAAAIGLALFVVGAFLGLRSDSLEGMKGVLYLLRIWVVMVLYAVPFVAFLGLMSALVGRARRSFNFTLLYWFAVATISGIANAAYDIEGIDKLFPTAGRFNLLLDDMGKVSGTATYLVIFTVVAGGLGLWRFRSRDL